LSHGGESEQRLYLLDVWTESRLYTPRERAALAWTEAVTRIADTRAPDAVYDALSPHFSDKEIVDLTTLIGLIILWNRLATGKNLWGPKTQAFVTTRNDRMSRCLTSSAR
jgi:alkylhydroperoxidase family enzyme